MWDVIKNAVTSVKDALGIELPEIPADLSALGETAATAVSTASDSAAEVVTTATEGLSDVTDAASTNLPTKP